VLLDLAPSRKLPGSFDRTRAYAETLALEPAIRALYGITRVADLTQLDRIGIPVYSAVVPDARDSVSVYAGKGTTHEAARAGAIMEAAERGAVRRATTAPRTGKRSSNGLASGNTASEAVYHALCEVIERHVFSVAHALAHGRPRAVVARLLGGSVALPGFVDDPVATAYAPPTGSAIVDGLMARIAGAGVAVRLRAVELRPFPPLFVATIGDDDGPPSRTFCGYGMSLTPEHAAVRAITEAVQARLIDIQTAREDLAPDDVVAGVVVRRRTPPRTGAWYYDAPARGSSLNALVDRASCDVATDVATLFALIADAGFEEPAIVDLSPAELPIAVVRVVAPGLETAMVDGAIGPTIAGILDVTRALSTDLLAC
jgi:ribosomal protein S12 methylthiotransferase accessory factor